MKCENCGSQVTGYGCTCDACANAQPDPAPDPRDRDLAILRAQVRVLAGTLDKLWRDWMAFTETKHPLQWTAEERRQVECAINLRALLLASEVQAEKEVSIESKA